MCENEYVLERAVRDRLREARERSATRQLLSGASGAPPSPEPPAPGAPAGWPGAGHVMGWWRQRVTRIATRSSRGAGCSRGAGGSLGAAASRSR